MGPSVEAWAAMTPAAREAFLLDVIDYHSRSGRREWGDWSAELFGTDDLIDRLTGMVGRLEARADAAAEQAEAALDGLRAAVLATLEARGVACPDDLRARVLASDDPAALQRWLLRALTAATADEALG